MREFFKSLNEFVERGSDIYSIECALVVRISNGRTKGDILSDIRALEGVTIVTPGESTKQTAALEASHVTIKIDTNPLTKKSVTVNLLRIKKEILRLSGVVTFKYTSSPSIV